MDFTLLITEYGPSVLALVAVIATAAWGIFKAVAPLTKSTADDEFVAKHGDEVENILDKLEKK